MIIDWMKMTRQFSLAAASVHPRPNPEKDIKNGALDIFRGIIVRGNINLYAAIIALAFSNGKELSS